MVDVLCFDSTYNCCLHHLEHKSSWNRYAFEYNKHNSVLYRIIYLLPIQTHIAGNWKWYHHWCSYYPSGLWIEHYGQHKLLFYINPMLDLINNYNLRKSRETLYHKNYNYLNTWRTYQRAKIYLLQYYLNDQIRISSRKFKIRVKIKIGRCTLLND